MKIYNYEIEWKKPKNDKQFWCWQERGKVIAETIEEAEARIMESARNSTHSKANPADNDVLNIEPIIITKSIFEFNPCRKFFDQSREIFLIDADGHKYVDDYCDF